MYTRTPILDKCFFKYAYIHIGNNLWTQHKVTKNAVLLPEDIKTGVLKKVIVLLVTVNPIETSATYDYLQPLDDHENLYRFDHGGQQAKIITYFIGKYGACPAAIRNGFKMCDSSSTMFVMDNQCFPNLSAIISVGVVCGIKEKVQLYDVLVSTKVVNYKNMKIKERESLQGEETITVSPQLLNLFTQPSRWPNDSIKAHLKNNAVQIPNVKYGMIVNRPYLFGDLVLPLENLLAKICSHDAIGIEMDETYLFKENQEIPISTIIVKAVCTFEDGNSIKEHQHTAASIAADLVFKCLSEPQAPDILSMCYYIRSYT